jgi:cytochrome subunit of sulfide dehydrogenase
MLLALALAMLPVRAGAASLPPPDTANCIGCHPRTGGDPTLPQLVGHNANDIVAAMSAFRSGKRPATVMDRIAKGYSDDEIAAIAAWYAAQK